MKTCKICSVDFPATTEYFYKNVSKGKTYLDSYCKKCKTNKKVEWQRNNRDKVNASAATYRTKNKDIMNKKMNEYYYKNKEKYNGYDRKRRALKIGNGFEKYEDSQVLDLYGTNCYLCDMPIDLNAPRKVGVDGWKTGLHIEHFVAIANGGPDTLDNVRPSHGWCNLSKNAKVM
jgi:hypothetical protein